MLDLKYLFTIRLGVEVADLRIPWLDIHSKYTREVLWGIAQSTLGVGVDGGVTLLLGKEKHK